MLDMRNVNSDDVEAIDVETQAKYEHLLTILRDMESVLIAYSGGVDSALLLKVASDVLGTRAMGVIASSPAYAAEETEKRWLSQNKWVFQSSRLKHMKWKMSVISPMTLIAATSAKQNSLLD